MFFRPYGPTASEFPSSLFSLQVPSASQRLPARTTFEVLPVCPGAFLISIVGLLFFQLYFVSSLIYVFVLIVFFLFYFPSILF